MSGQPPSLGAAPEPTILSTDPATVPRHSDAAMASMRRGLEAKHAAELAALEARLGQTPAAPAAAPATTAVPEWVAALSAKLDALGATTIAAPATISQVPPAAAPAAAPPAAASAPLTLAQALAAMRPGAPGNPAPPAPAPIPVNDLARQQVHPNKLTADQVARLGPQGTLDYVTNYFRKGAP